MSTDRFEAPAEGGFPIGDPYAGAEIATAIETLHEESLAYLATISDEEFLAPQGEFWSPADHLRHLRRSCRPVATALALPRTVLGLRFGRSRSRSRDLGSVIAVYHEALAAGGSARGTPFEPRPQEVEGPRDAWREALVGRWTGAVSDVVAASRRWSEAALDRYRLPHPLLGKMTVREILLFTLYHNAHHIRRVAERAHAGKGVTR